MRLENRQKTAAVRGSGVWRKGGSVESLFHGSRSQGLDALPIMVMLSHAFSGTEDTLGIDDEKRDDDIRAMQGFNQTYRPYRPDEI